MIRALARILKVLNSESEPGQISGAVILAMIAGLTPLFSLHNLLVLFLVTALRVNLSAFMLSLVLFSGIGVLLDPLFHWLGLALLTTGALEGLWATLYGMPLFRLADFNNSVVMGSFVLSLLLSVPAYFLLNTLIRKYREHVLEWVRKTRLMRAFQASKIYRAYQSVSDWGGAG